MVVGQEFATVKFDIIVIPVLIQDLKVYLILVLYTKKC